MKTILRFAGLLFVSAAASAQVSVSSYGVEDLSVEVLDAWGMEVLSPGAAWSKTAQGHRYATSSNDFFVGIPKLPDGAQVVSFELQACDTSGGGEVFAGLVLFDDAGPGTLGVTSTGEIASPGCARFLHTLAAPTIVNNALYRYQVEAGNTTVDGNTSIGAVRIFYRRQVSPAPATATFGDVPTSHLSFNSSRRSPPRGSRPAAAAGTSARTRR